MEAFVEDEGSNAFQILLSTSPFRKVFVNITIYYAKPLSFSGIGGTVKILGESSMSSLPMMDPFYHA